MNALIMFVWLPVVIAVVTLSCGVESFTYGRALSSGTAVPGFRYEDKSTGAIATSKRRKVDMDHPLTQWECIEDCNQYCRQYDRQPPRRVRVDGSGTICFCDSIPLDLSNLAYVGNTNSEEECADKVFNAGYVYYFYDYGRCSAENRYENIGTSKTKGECVEMAKQIAPWKKAVFHSSNNELLCY